jgi:pSer/pThr/pTyr-binding forkhead associated (FHA) protein
VADSSSAYLEFVEDGVLREVFIPRDCVFQVGRSPMSNLLLRDRGVGRTHAILQWASDGVYITHCGSRNGTLVNGVCISAPQLLHSNDQIQIGHELLTFRERRSV